MIKSYGNGKTQRFYENRKDPRYSGLDKDLALQRLDELDAAASLSDISPLNSMGLHKLRGPMSGYWAISVNHGWRIVFRFKGGDALSVQIIDYHD